MNVENMVQRQLIGRDITDQAVLAAMQKVPRPEFVPQHLGSQAYADQPLPIGHGQTISQPYMVAFMTQVLALKPGERVLEIGTGCGYQTAVLCEMGALVYSVEIQDELSHLAQRTLAKLGYDSIQFKIGDGHLGWAEAAPFDAILVAAAPNRVPRALLDQLGRQGRMVIPEGSPRSIQNLNFYKKNRNDLVSSTSLMSVRFVPLVHE